jgi:hypothetical protein
LPLSFDLALLLFCCAGEQIKPVDGALKMALECQRSATGWRWTISFFGSFQPRAFLDDIAIVQPPGPAAF